MKLVGIRTYSIPKAEFPIEIVITAVQLPVNRAVVGQPRVTKDGILHERLVPNVVEDISAGIVRYEIPLPASPPAVPFDITQTVDCWFTDGAKSDAKYHFVIKSQSGDEFPTNVRVPTLNPGTANLAFQVE
jgi:hypothetical protein